MSGFYAEAVGAFGDWVGLVLAGVVGVLLVVVVLFIRAKLGRDLGAAGIVFGLLPVAVWLVVGGHVSRFAFAGVEFEAGDAILAASREPVADQVASIDAIIDEIGSTEREEKRAPGAIPRLVERKIQALEFRFGRGDYYAGSVIQDYLEQLTQHPFFRYVLIFDQRSGLFGMYEENALVTNLCSRQSGYDWFADALGRGDEPAREELMAIPGFVAGSFAITPGAPKREALESMELHGISFLPVVRLDVGFVGVVERDRLTASLILDVTSALDVLK